MKDMQTYRIEKWHEIARRHKQERIDLVYRLRDQGLTQTQAAKQLGISLRNLNNYIHRNRLDWPVNREGRWS